MGTYGYAAPEYVATGMLCPHACLPSADIYLLMIQCCFPAMNRQRVHVLVSQIMC